MILCVCVSPLSCVSVSLQLDNPDEQAAQIRRELDGRLQMADQIARVQMMCQYKSLFVLCCV